MANAAAGNGACQIRRAQSLVLVSCDLLWLIVGFASLTAGGRLHGGPAQHDRGVRQSGGRELHTGEYLPPARLPWLFRKSIANHLKMLPSALLPAVTFISSQHGSQTSRLLAAPAAGTTPARAHLPVPRRPPQSNSERECFLQLQATVPPGITAPLVLQSAVGGPSSALGQQDPGAVDGGGTTEGSDTGGGGGGGQRLAPGVIGGIVGGAAGGGKDSTLYRAVAHDQNARACCTAVVVTFGWVGVLRPVHRLRTRCTTAWS